MQSVTLTVKTAPPDKSSLSIFHAGQAFYLAGNRCLLNIEVGPGVMQCLTSPGVVNLCFASELFLKSLLLASGSLPPKTHKLAELFGLLPASDAAAVTTSYAQSVSTPSFAEFINEVSEFFVKIRYEFSIFAFHEVPVWIFAKALYVHAANVNHVSTKLENVNL